MVKPAGADQSHFGFLVVISEMSSGNIVANSVLMVANLFSALKISRLVVPEVVQSDGSAVLDCEYTAHHEGFVLQWLLDGQLMYEWKPPHQPRVVGVLDGKLDMDFRNKQDSLSEYRALRILRVVPELSGNYTCVLKSGEEDDRQTKAMLVFSPENDLSLTVSQDQSGELSLNCLARGTYPEPNLVIEHNRIVITKQSHRVWRNDSLYDAMSWSEIAVRDVRDGDKVTCRLDILPAGYVAMRETTLDMDDIRKRSRLLKCVENHKSDPTLQCSNSSEKHHWHSWFMMTYIIYYNIKSILGL